MSDYDNDCITVSLDCGCATALDIVPLAINAFRAAVLDNWTKLSSLPPGFWPNVDEDLSTADVERILDEITKFRGSSLNSISEYFPQSCHQMFFAFREKRSGAFVITLSIPVTAMSEVEGTRKQGEMVWEWYKSQTSFHAELPGPDDMDEGTLNRWHEDYNRLGNTPSIWPQSRQCFLNVVEHVKSALKVETVKIDQRLLD